MEKRVTLKDIADALGVSVGTVDRAIHGKKDINPETKRRVLEKVKELNYRPNKYARSLSVKNKKKIMIIMPYISRFWHDVKSGLDYAERELSYYGIEVKFIGLNKVNGHLVASLINSAKEEKCDGLILVPSGTEEEKESLKQLISDNIPFVLLNDDIPELPGKIYVGPDNELVGKLAGELIGKFTQGKGKCLVLVCHNAKTGQMLLECKKRLEGFKQVLQQDYPQLQVKTESYEIYHEDAYNAVLRALEQDDEISCIYGADGCIDEAAMALKNSGRKGIPLVGHEMSETVNQFLQEDIICATICQNPFLQGYHALKYLVEYLIEGKKPEEDSIYIDFKIYTKYNNYRNESSVMHREAMKL